MPNLLTKDDIQHRLASLGSGWGLNDAGYLSANYRFTNFQEAMDFANSVGNLAETANHHPDLLIGWGKCAIELWTHDAGGLTTADFDLAQQISDCYDALP